MTIAIKTSIGSPHATTRRVSTIQVVREEYHSPDVVLFSACRNGVDGMEVAAREVVSHIRTVADNVERELTEAGILKADAVPPAKALGVEDLRRAFEELVAVAKEGYSTGWDPLDKRDKLAQIADLEQRAIDAHNIASQP